MENNLKIAHKASGPLQIDSAKKLYDVLKKLPPPSANMKLNAAQKKWWYWFGYEFVKTKKISMLDLTHLQKASFWMDARSKAIFETNKKGYKGGLVQTFTSGATNVSGHVSIIEKADKHLDEVSAHFGLSIKDRQKLSSNTDSNPNQLNFLKGSEYRLITLSFLYIMFKIM